MILYIIAIFITLSASFVQASCPLNELIYNVTVPLSYSFEQRDGSGEDVINITNKRIAISYWDGSAVKWWNATDWTSTTEQLLTMTQVAGSQYRYNFIPNATVQGQYLMFRFDEIDNIDVTRTCVAYVQNANRFDDTTDYVKLSAGTGTGQVSLSSGTVTVGSINTGAITTASIADGAITQAKEYVIAGTEDVTGASTTLKVYTALGVASARTYNNMCLYSASNGERSRILSTGSGFFNVRGFSVAPADTTVLRIYSDGCL